MSSGGGGGSTPTLINDNLTSKQFYRVLDIITEGPIYGPVDQEHLSSFRLNKTPITNNAGVVSVPGVSVAWRPGSATQTPINGFSAVESTTIVNANVTQATPLVRTITDSNVTRVRLNIGVSSLVEQDTQGNQRNTSVTMVIETRVGNGSFQAVKTVTIGPNKISGEYLEAHLIDALETKPFDIRVRRITADSTSDLLKNGTIWNSFTEMIDDNLSYPYTAVCGAVIDRDQYTDTPNRTYHLRGLIVDVPDNYDPITRTYTGLWLGGFKSAWTNNPAWIFRMLVKNTRYGLARRAGYIDVDDGSLYVLSQFCDQKVEDGFGGEEPRFTLNAYITEQKSARELLDDIAGMFRGIALWDGMRFSIMIDRPQDPVAVVTNASVVDGLFTYSAMKRSERYNAVVVSWTDPNNGWEQVKEYYSDDEMISSSGAYNETTIEAFGCTSRGQARRTAKWLVESAKLEKDKVTFRMARDAIGFIPGDIVELMDNNRAAARLGGRIVSHSGVVINVDADVSALAGNGDTMSIMGANAKFTKYEIASVNGSAITLKVAPAWVRDGTTFAISTSEVSTRLFRIMGISEDENNSIYSISATLHNPNKQAIVDEGAVFDVPSDTLNGYRVPNIENLRVINTNSENVQVSASWETATTTRKLVFELLVYTLDGKVFAQYETDQFRYDFFGIPAGMYSLGVRGRNDNGMKGAETQVSLLIGAPPMPSSVRWTPGIFSADVVPVMNITATTDTTFEFWWTGEVPASSAANIENEAQFLGRSTQWTLNGLKAETTYYVYVRTRNAFGVSAFVEASGIASSDIPGMIDYIDQAIKGSETFGQLSSDLDMNSEAIIENALANDADVHRWKKQNGDFRAEIFDIRQTVITESAATATLIEGVQSQVGENSAAIERRAETIVNVDGTGSAITTLKVGAEFNGVYKSAGMAIGVEFNGSNWTSQILFSANTFGVYNPNDNSYKLAFAIENGQTFINEAFINYASITLAKIGEWKSANFVSGQTGTRMASDGSFEMNGAVAGEGKLNLVNNRITVFNESNQVVVVIGKKLVV
ncbi:host specificity protein J [Yersinia aleksiciae]|uniref:host specificity protein J n=1 Tax=Yersinia aleksiciae TaxID=263819 RepID=UPI001427D4B8|nr:phage tail protein [Yersinia aleksiciae]MDA5496961.1 phage tail protein [Yersinia aleksiciae]NIK98657.1 host specificity protein J [Yersinia aleksiciae]WQC72424.1 phage tail protein [Yersinia aleksiciae]